MKSLADLLSNVDAPVNEKTLVMYLLNGLNEKYDNTINVIKHKDLFPSFDNAKSMLEMEESRLKKPKRAAATHTNHFSSPSALTITENSQHNQHQPNQHKSKTTTIGETRRTTTATVATVETTTSAPTIQRGFQTKTGMVPSMPGHNSFQTGVHSFSNQLT